MFVFTLFPQKQFGYLFLTENIFTYNITKYIFYFELSIFHFIFSFIKIVIINLFQFQYFISSIFLSTIEVFKVFSNDNVITLIQSLSFVNVIFDFEIHSLVNNIAIKVSRAVLFEEYYPHRD